MLKLPLSEHVHLRLLEEREAARSRTDSASSPRVLRQSEKVGERRYDIVLYSMLSPDWQAVGRPAPAASA